MAIYERQTPETSLMYRVVARQWPRIVADYNAHGVTIPSYVSAEVERFLRCGILQYGFLLLRCPACDAEKVIGFSCKTRGGVATGRCKAMGFDVSLSSPSVFGLVRVSHDSGDPYGQ